MNYRVARATRLCANSCAFAALALSILLLPCSSDASGAEALRIRGRAVLEAHVSRDRGEIVFSGSLVDDAGQALAREGLTILLARQSEPTGTEVRENLQGVRSCDPRAAGGVARAGEHASGQVGVHDVVATTDDGGHFCFRVKLATAQFKARLAWRGTSFIDGVEAEVAFDAARQLLRLQFDPLPSNLSLDTQSMAFEIDARVEEDGRTLRKPGLLLVLSDESRSELARTTTDASGRARFDVDTKKMGPPGQGRLHVSFAGDAQISQSVYAAEIERRVSVAVRGPAVAREVGVFDDSLQDDSFDLTLDVTSVRGPVTGGSVEGRIGDHVIAAAPAVLGKAKLSGRLNLLGADRWMHVRYVSTSPWYEPGGVTTVSIPFRTPSFLAKVPILLASVFVLGGFLLTRIASRHRQAIPAPGTSSASSRALPRARLDVIREASKDEHGWRGRVIDAHDLTPIENAHVWVERGTFDGKTILHEVLVDAKGRFQIPELAGLVGVEQIGVEAKLHARLLQPLPTSGELRVALLLRKRALLDRLVSWARHRGPPVEGRPEPTPTEVRCAKGADAQTVRWAEALEHAAFGPGSVDAQRETTIDQLSPDPPHRETALNDFAPPKRANAKGPPRESGKKQRERSE